MMLEKRRWLLIDALGVSGSEFTSCVDEAIAGFSGVNGASRARAQAETVSGFNVVRCTRAALEEVISALAFKKEFKGKRVALRTVRVSGTLDALLAGKRKAK